MLWKQAGVFFGISTCIFFSLVWQSWQHQLHGKLVPFTLNNMRADWSFLAGRKSNWMFFEGVPFCMVNQPDSIRAVSLHWTITPYLTWIQSTLIGRKLLYFHLCKFWNEENHHCLNKCRFSVVSHKKRFHLIKSFILVKWRVFFLLLISFPIYNSKCAVQNSSLLLLHLLSFLLFKTLTVTVDKIMISTMCSSMSKLPPCLPGFFPSLLSNQAEILYASFVDKRMSCNGALWT